MAYSPAHLAELGLTRWRLRSESAAVPVTAESPRESAAVPPETRAPAPRPPAAIAEEPVLEDRDERAARIARMGWEELEAYVNAQSRPGASRAVFGVGARDAELLIVGEAPGAEEDRRGEPFVGRAGQLLDRMLAAIGLNRQRSVYIANICKFRPPNNRDPRANEVAEDWPYLLRQIELLQPRLLLAIGRVAAQTLLATEAPIGRLRNREHRFAAQDLPVIVSYHPAYLLRSPREKAKAWQDLKRVREHLARSGD